MNLRLIILLLLQLVVDWDNASPTNVYDISISSDGGLTWTDFDSYQDSAVTFTNLIHLLLTK